MAREATLEDFNEFCIFLKENHPDIDKQLPKQVFINGTIGAFQPAKMSNEDYESYNQILREWLESKGIN